MGMIPCFAELKADSKEFRAQALPGGRVVVPRFHYGFLVYLHFPGAGAPHFSLLDPVADRIVARITTAAPGAQETFPIDLAVFPDRSRLVASVATKNVSGGRSLWLLFYSMDGKLIQSEKVSPFHPHLLAVAPDNTIWGLGVNANTYMEKDSPEPVLYRWSETGTLLRKLLAHRDFPEDVTLGEPIPPYGLTCLAVSRGRVAVFAAGSGLLAEITPGGDVLGIHKPARPLGRDGKPASMSGLAVTGDGTIYAGLGDIHRFDRASRGWVRVEEPKALSGRHSIFGGAGNEILLSGASGDRFHFRLVTLR
jgi:hypothetical protein